MPSTDTPAVEDLNGVRRALRDELIRLGGDLDLAEDQRDAAFIANVLATGAVAYTTLGGDLEKGPTDAQRALEQERDQAVLQGRRMAEAIDSVVTAAQELGGSYFEGDAFADFRAAFEKLARSSPRNPPIHANAR